MDTKELSNRMREEARSLGLCDEWYNAWGDASVQDMLDKLKKGFDFVIQHRHEWLYPDFIKEQAGEELLRKNGILANDKWSLLNPRECFILGKSESNLRCNARNVCRAWVLGDSKVEITARNACHLIIEVYDTPHITILHRDATARVVVINHSSKATIETLNGCSVELKYAEDYA